MMSYFTSLAEAILYNPIFLTFLVVFITQSIYRFYLLTGMFLKQSRLLYSLFHKVDTASKKHGGELVAQVFKSHGVENIFTLPGGHISPIVVASNQLGIRVIDVRHEATAVFAADAAARMSSVPGVAVVTAGPGLTNTITAIKNAQMAESPVVVIAGAAATMLKNRGSLQDIDQISLLKTATKKCFTVDCVRDIIPTMREAFRLTQIGVPGPVFVELPIDILYPYSIIAEQFASMSSTKDRAKKTSIKGKIIEAYTNYSLNHIFADAFKEQSLDPLPVSVKKPDLREVEQVAAFMRLSKRPLIILGSQAMLKPYGPDTVVEDIKRLGVPVYLTSGARGCLGSDYPRQFRHARREALKEADLVLLLGAIADFRLSYGRAFGRQSKIVSVNRSLTNAKLNASVFWNPTLAIKSDVGTFIRNLTQSLLGDKGQSVQPELSIDSQWIKTMRERDDAKDKSIDEMGARQTDKYLNPLRLIKQVQEIFKKDDTILVADGGDFVASASYIMKPNGPLRWLDPGPFGTLGCGAGFALASKLLNPDKKVVVIAGDGAFGYAIPELDTLVRHKVSVFWVIGNDACWTQIAREQVPMLGSPVGCQLGYTDYHKVAEGFGAKAFLVSEPSDLVSENSALIQAKKQVDDDNIVVVNGLIGNTSFRDGSISV